MDQFASARWDDLVNERALHGRRRTHRGRSELKRRIAQLKAESDCRRFPTDVKALATAAGIHDVRHAPLAMRGRLVREGSAVVAEINEALSPRNKRFVLAHEIAHVLISRDLANAGPLAIFGSEQATSSYNLVEELCDFGAREILLPENAVLQQLKLTRISLEQVTSMAEEAACDLEVVAQCICELPGRWKDLLFLFCELTSHGFVVSKTIPSASCVFELPENPKDLLHRALESSVPVSGQQEIWSDFACRSVIAEATAAGSKIAVLLIDRTKLP